MAATKRRAGTSLAPRRHSGAITKAKAELAAMRQRSARARAVAKEEARDRMGALIGVGAAGIYGWVEKKREKEGKSTRIAGIEPTVLIGPVLGFLAPAFLPKGDMRTWLAEAGVAVSAVGAYKIGTGVEVRVEEEEA